MHLETESGATNDNAKPETNNGGSRIGCQDPPTQRWVYSAPKLRCFDPPFTTLIAGVCPAGIRPGATTKRVKGRRFELPLMPKLCGVRFGLQKTDRGDAPAGLAPNSPNATNDNRIRETALAILTFISFPPVCRCIL